MVQPGKTRVKKMMKELDTTKWGNEGLTPFESDLEYLQEELEWVELRCKRIVTQRRFDKVPGDEDFGDDEHDGATGIESYYLPAGYFTGRLEDMVTDEVRQRWEVDQRRRLTVDRSLSLDRLCQLRELDDFERVVLILSCATSVSRRFQGLFGSLVRQRSSSLTPEVVFEFMEMPLAERIMRRTVFSPRARLMKNDLIMMAMYGRHLSTEDMLNMEVDIPQPTFNYIMGIHGLADEFQEFSSFEEPMATLDQVVLDGEDKRRILTVVERHDKYLECRKQWGFDDLIRYGKGVLMLFHGKPGTGKTMTAHAIAHKLGMRILNVDIPTFVEARDAERFLPGLFREARLHNALLFFDECEVLFADRFQGNVLMTMLLTEIERFEGIAILATNQPEALDRALDRRIMVKVLFPEPDRSSRLEIWRKHLPATAPIAPDVDLEALAERFDMAGGYIKNAVLMAVAEAVHSDGDQPVIRMEHLEDAARAQVHRPTDKESGLQIPTARLSDLVLPHQVSAQIDELVAGARNRKTVLERWGIGKHLTRGKGISALFHGDPGTGKTLAAEAVAAELGRPLKVASVPTLVSKWVGQTEKNLSSLFAEARSSGAVVFLDEADSLLTTRGEGNASRHDDSAVNVLLQLVEEHDGVTLLATNLAARLDPALCRRLSYMLRFPLPDAQARTNIWKKHLPPTAPLDASVDLQRLGETYRLSGGQIRNAVFKAAFRAARNSTTISHQLLDSAAAEESGASLDNKGPIGFTSGR